MPQPGRPAKTTAAVTLLLLTAATALAQRPDTPWEAFAARRAELMANLGEGIAVLFGEVDAQPGDHFRQDNDFFYLTGVEDKNAVLVLVPRTNRTILLLPDQSPREARMERGNLLKQEGAQERTGFSTITTLGQLDELLARQTADGAHGLWLRLSGRDPMDGTRGESLLRQARTARTHYNDWLTPDAHRVAKLRDRYPAFPLRDLAPHLDAMRVIKRPEEVALLRQSAALAARGLAAAMRATRPGMYEYELEAVAAREVLAGGARLSFTPIVASGPNACIGHYEENSRRIEDGDLVLFDFGADYGYMTSDVTRTWPASGRFTDEQREVYATALAVQKACIEAYRPGATDADVKAHVAAVMKANGIDARGLEGGIGHYVGMAVHDVGPGDLPLREGMVIAIEPWLSYPAKGLSVRIEDTVLITGDGCEVLSAGVPREIADVERLLASGRPGSAGAAAGVGDYPPGLTPLHRDESVDATVHSRFGLDNALAGVARVREALTGFARLTAAVRGASALALLEGIPFTDVETQTIGFHNLPAMLEGALRLQDWQVARLRLELALARGDGGPDGEAALRAAADSSESAFRRFWAYAGIAD